MFFLNFKKRMSGQEEDDIKHGVKTNMHIKGIVTKKKLALWFHSLYHHEN